jgi:hypothetical protein
MHAVKKIHSKETQSLNVEVSRAVHSVKIMVKFLNFLGKNFFLVSVEFVMRLAHAALDLQQSATTSTR